MPATVDLQELETKVRDMYCHVARQPHGRLVSATEVAAAVLYLVSREASSTTGTSIAVDGGMAELRLRPRS